MANESVREINQLIFRAHETATEKGWWSHDRTFGDQIALMHSELSEALEEFRKGVLFNEIYRDNGVGGRHPFEIAKKLEGVDAKPEGIAVEFADVLIRIFDTCGQYNIPLAKALEAKLEYNKSRPYRHGGKAL